MKFLAIETATEACSAALYIDGTTTSRYEFAPQRHAELILPMIDALLSDAKLKLNALDALSFGRGPGSFTGVRIATGIIQGLAFALDLPVIPVSTLAVLAQGKAAHDEFLLSAIDARMGEIYWCLYQTGKDSLVTPLSNESITAPELVSVPEDIKWYCAGSGWGSYSEILLKSTDGNITGGDGEAFPHAKDIVPLALKAYDSGQAFPAEEALPVYLRNQVTDQAG